MVRRVFLPLLAFLFLLCSVGPKPVESSRAEKPRITDFQISATSISWRCSPPESCRVWNIQGHCQPTGPPTDSCKMPKKRKVKRQNSTVYCENLHPFSSYHVSIYCISYSWHRFNLYEKDFTTKEGVPDQPEREVLDLSSRLLQWKPPPPCKGKIVGYQVNVTATRAYNASFLEEEQILVNSSVTKYEQSSWRPGTNYTVTVQAVTSAGPGEALRWDLETGISEPFVPPGLRVQSVCNISASAGTVVLPLEPVPDLHGPVWEYQVLVGPLQDPPPTSSSCCSLQLQPFNASQEEPQLYTAVVLPAHSVAWPTDLVLGDGTVRRGFCNAPLRPGRNYSALLRIISRWKQEEKCSCLHYDFLLGETHMDAEGHGMALVPLVGTAGLLLLALLLLMLLLLWLLVARRKRKKTEEPSMDRAVPLQRHRGGASKLHTRIPVAELLEVLKRHKRAEVEAAAAASDEEDEGGAQRAAAGRDAEYQKLAVGLLHPCLAGKEPQNAGKNRYKSILPYDQSRVVLQPSGSVAGDYINASYIDSYKSPRFFIAAQGPPETPPSPSEPGPLPNTVVDFWRMVWQEKTPVIMMLTDLVEHNKPKCEQYWDSREQQSGDITVVLSGTRTAPGLVTRTFSLRKAGAALPRRVEQMHVLSWPDHGLPRDPARLLKWLEVVNRRAAEASPPGAGPVLVHCSAGIGRTGSFIALDYLLKMAGAEGHVDVFHCVQRLRQQRTGMVQTQGQYAFLYEALLEGLLCGNTGVPVDDTAGPAGLLEAVRGRMQSDGCTQEFQALDRLSEFFHLTPRREAEKPCNRLKNRNPEILPADFSRPILMSSLKPDGTPGYINATFVDAYTREEHFIATQLPLPGTLVDFWALVWDYGCRLLVLLNPLRELDPQVYPEFWPTSGMITYGAFCVELSSEEVQDSFTVRTLTVSNNQQPQAPPTEVRFWQLDDWPAAQPLPPHPAVLLRFLRALEEEEPPSPGGHVLVACRDGVSRCGLFCAASLLREQIQAEGEVDVSQVVRMLKRRQTHFVKDVEQYRLCYHLALCFLDSFLP